VRTALRPRRRARSAEHKTETGNLAVRVLTALTAHNEQESKSHETTPDRDRVGVTSNFNDTIRQLVEDNLRKKYALLEKTLIDTLTAQEAAAHAHKKAGFTAHTAAAKSSHAAATATRGKRRIPHAGEPTANYGMDAPTSGKASKGGRRRRRPRLGGDRSAERMAEDKKQRDTSGTTLEREGVG